MNWDVNGSVVDNAMFGDYEDLRGVSWRGSQKKWLRTLLSKMFARLFSIF